ncbi:MAG: rhomboid family intramembrane serine protease [Acidobacteriaceae bacterium]|nr:rhomboid family intramembrane serine protease [Acidobacteriaceae bacterium]
MPSSNPITMTFPPFAGAVRKLVIANVALFFIAAALQWLAPGLASLLLDHLLLQPLAVAHGAIWQLASYSFLDFSLLDILFAMLTLWFLGSMLEGAYGSLWLLELYFSSTIGGALLASVVSFTHLLHLSPYAVANGSWAGIFGLLIAIAMRFGDQEFLLFFVASIRAKYMVAIYILIAVAVLLKDANAFGALLQLSGALCGYLFVRFAPRRGLAFGLSEQFYGLRNAYYRAKRRRAARKFEVYMGKQGRQVRFDKEGRYIAPDDANKDSAERKDSNDKRWMN